MSDAHKARERLYRQSRWLQLRKKHLAKFPCCRICGTKQNLQIDHIESTKLNMDRFYDPTNLQTLCISHHGQKTILDQGKKIKYPVDENGYPTAPDHFWVKEE